MSRRSSVERIFSEVQSAVTASGSTLLAPSVGVIVDPRSVVLTAGASPVVAELQSNGVAFMHINVPANSTEQIAWPDGVELPLGSGVALVTSATTDVTFHYCLHDENPGVTKVASRTATYNNVTVTRTPNQFGNDAKT